MVFQKCQILFGTLSNCSSVQYCNSNTFLYCSPFSYRSWYLCFISFIDFTHLIIFCIAPCKAFALLQTHAKTLQRTLEKSPILQLDNLISQKLFDILGAPIIHSPSVKGVTINPWIENLNWIIMIIETLVVLSNISRALRIQIIKNNLI